jgi:MFS family permease
VTLQRFRTVYRATRPVARASVSFAYLLHSGLSTVISIPIVRAALLVTLIINVLVSPYQQLMSIVAVEILEVGPEKMGLLMAAAGVGSGSVAGFLAFRARPAATGAVYIGGATLASIALIGLAASTWFELSLALQMIVGASFGAFGAMQAALIVNAVPPEMRARALGILAMAIGTGPFGYLLIGTLSGLVGPSLTIGGMAFLASVMLVAISIRYRRILFRL